jgi:hypothetical protein
MGAQETNRKVALGGLLHRIGSFNPTSYESDFNARLRLQKTVYLMQEFGLNIGYWFSWYLRGPYSPNLTRDTYKLAKIYSRIQPVKFANPIKENRFCEFLAFIRPISRDHNRLERIAVVHFLSSMYPYLSLNELYTKVNNKIPSVTFEEFQEIRRTLKNYNLLRSE